MSRASSDSSHLPWTFDEICHEVQFDVAFDWVEEVSRVSQFSEDNGDHIHEIVLSISTGGDLLRRLLLFSVNFPLLRNSSFTLICKSSFLLFKSLRRKNLSFSR